MQNFSKKCPACGEYFSRKCAARTIAARFCGHKCYAKIRPSKPIEDRFWPKVDKRGNDECWNWKTKNADKDYGGIWYNGKITKSHRASYEIHNGTIPDGMVVMHSCDNPACVNPAHLSLGTQYDNIADRHAKGRSRGGSNRGELSGQSKLTEEMVREIRRYLSIGVLTHQEIAYFFGVVNQTISSINTRKIWAHI